MLANPKPELLQKMLHNCPLGIILINSEGIIEWVNNSLCSILHIENSELIAQRKDNIDPELIGLFEDGATIHLTATAKHDDIWLLNVALQNDPDNNNSCIHYISDVSSLHTLAVKHEDLKTEYEDVNVIDAVTGLPNRRAIYQALEPQVSRSRRYENPLSIIIMKLNDYDTIENNYGEPTTNKIMLDISHMLNDQLRWADTIGKLENDEFIFVLPETDSNASQVLINKVKEHLSEIVLNENNKLPEIINTQFGSASWQKGDDVGMLMRRAREELAC